MTENRKTPKLRFKGFTDAWEQRKFSDVVEIGSGMDYKHLGIGDIPVYGTGGYMLSVDMALSENNDAIGIGRKGTIDKPYILRAPFWTVDTLFYCIPKYNHYLDFTNCLFQNIDWKNKDESTGVPSLSKVIINNIETSIPSYEEQKKIGEYFKSFENLITLHQRKLDRLKNIKKSMLDKMFPKDGEVVPEIRFKGFTDAWEQRKVSDIGEVITGFTPSTQHSEYYSEDGIPWVTPTDIVDNIIHDTPRKLSPLGEKVGRVVPANTILVTCIASIGKNTMLANTGSFNQQINGLVPYNKKYDPYFLLTESFHWSSKMKREASAGTMQIVNKNEFSAIDTYVPEWDEQKAIGNYFRQLDNLITLHQRKLDKLKNIKKSMLDNMFV